jgi:hypothetical protein
MRKLLPLTTLGLAGLVGLGLMSVPATNVAADFGDKAFTKREDQQTELVLVDDDADDDETQSRFTGLSRSTNDGTRSNFTRVSRDRDLSRSDKTRDRTLDGPGDTRTRDWTPNRTNDRSRNDSRGRR